MMSVGREGGREEGRENEGCEWVCLAMRVGVCMCVGE